MADPGEPSAYGKLTARTALSCYMWPVKEPGVDESLIRRWTRETGKGGLGSNAGKGIRSAESMGLERLRRELNRVKMERDVLKKALGYFARDPA